MARLVRAGFSGGRGHPPAGVGVRWVDGPGTGGRKGPVGGSGFRWSAAVGGRINVIRSGHESQAPGRGLCGQPAQTSFPQRGGMWQAPHGRAPRPLDLRVDSCFGVLTGGIGDGRGTNGETRPPVAGTWRRVGQTGCLHGGSPGKGRDSSCPRRPSWRIPMGAALVSRPYGEQFPGFFWAGGKG